MPLPCLLASGCETGQESIAFIRKDMTMVSITNVFQYFISKQSEEICKLKNSTLVRESFEKYAYVSPDGKSFVNRNSRRLDKAAGWKVAKVSYEKLTGFMSPKHPS